MEPSGGARLTARRLMIILVFLGSRDGTAWRHTLNRQATLAVQPNFGFSDEEPGGGN